MHFSSPLPPPLVLPSPCLMIDIVLVHYHRVFPSILPCFTSALLSLSSFEVMTEAITHCTYSVLQIDKYHEFS